VEYLDEDNCKVGDSDNVVATGQIGTGVLGGEPIEFPWDLTHDVCGVKMEVTIKT